MPNKPKTTYKNSEMEYAHREGQRLKENIRKAQWETELKAIKKRREEQRRKEDRGITYAPKRSTAGPRPTPKRPTKRPTRPAPKRPTAGPRPARPRRSPPRPR